MICPECGSAEVYPPSHDEYRWGCCECGHAWGESAEELRAKQERKDLRMNCVLLLSGGLDSAVLLWHLRDRGDTVRCLTVDYGQKGREITAAERVADSMGCEWEYAPLGCPHLLRGSALTGGKPLPQGVPPGDEAQAATVVPGRNLLLLALAAAYAVQTGASHVAYAATAADFAIYPDCRPLFVEAAATALWRGYGVKVEAPFLHWPKAQVVLRGRELGVPFERTWSCYAGGEVPCGTCGACLSREAAFLAASGVPAGR